jgi:hypothetical protein
MIMELLSTERISKTKHKNGSNLLWTRLNGQRVLTIECRYNNFLCDDAAMVVITTDATQNLSAGLSPLESS